MRFTSNWPLRLANRPQIRGRLVGGLCRTRSSAYHTDPDKCSLIQNFKTRPTTYSLSRMATSTCSASSYPYKPLDSAKSQIRLLEIHSANGADDVECSLITANLGENLQFTALSYVWGDESIVEPIVVDGHSIPVTVNLAAALRYAKQNWQNEFPPREAASFRLWVDALCINQKNTEERSSQVKLMGSLYTKAEMVLSWLGVGDEDVVLAMETLDLIARETKSITASAKELRLDWMTEHPKLCREDAGIEMGSKVWSAVGRFWMLPYWQRIWIFQEVILGAPRVVFAHGSFSLRWAALHDASVWLDSTYEAIQESFHPVPDHIDPGVWDIFIGGNCVPWTIRQVILVILIRSRLTNPQSHWCIFYCNRLLEATDPRDHIYGLLGVANFPIPIDYRKDIREVYWDFAIAWLQVNQNTDWLAYGGSGTFNYNPNLPSWAPNYSGIAKADGDFLIGLSDYARADEGVFPDTLAEPTLVDYKLELFAALGPVVVATQTFTSNLDGSWLDFIAKFMSKHATYVTGIHPLCAIFEVILNYECFKVPTHLWVARAFAF